MGSVDREERIRKLESEVKRLRERLDAFERWSWKLVEQIERKIGT